MISSDFAPNETFKDATASLSLFFTPWNWTKGDSLNKLRSRFKRLFPSYEPYLFLTGRACMYKLFQALELTRSSEVLVQAFTCEAVVLPLIELGLKPVYVDIETDTFSMNPQDLKKKISEKSKAIVLQHTFTMTPKFRQEILQIAQEKGLIIIEDLAHGFNANNLTNATAKPQSSIFLFSFGRSKSMSSVFGGAILSRNNILNKKLKEAEKNSQYPTSGFIIKALWYKPTAWFIKTTYDIFVGKAFHYLLNALGVFPRELSPKEKRGQFDPSSVRAYPNALAKLLLVQLKYFDQKRARRLDTVSYYKRSFSSILDGELSAPMIRFPLLVNKRAEVLSYLKRRGVYAGVWYDQVVAPKELPLSKMLYKKGSCPVAEVTCQMVINLPTTISKKEAERVADLVIQATG